jgi:GDPmannose 4,6-dehydratase
LQADVRGRRALITGVGGQDGSLLAELLLEEGYDVLGVVRLPGRNANLEAVQDRIELVQLNLLDQRSVSETLRRFQPHEVYNLGAVSFAPAWWDDAIGTAECVVVGVTALLESIRHVDPAIRFYQASSSEIFGEPQQSPQRESTAIAPISPYGAAKAFGHFLVFTYRRRYGLHASSGILYNHESERRAPDFLPRKVACGAASITLGLSRELVLGDLGARRDWGYARDYVRAMWLMLQQDEPDDYVIATGVAHTVEDLVACAFEHLDLDWRDHVRIDEALLRAPSAPHDVVGDASKARALLGWEPTLTFERLVQLLVDRELERLQAGPAVAGEAPV